MRGGGRGGSEAKREKPGVVRAHLMAQQKMRCALQRNHSDIQEVADREKGSLSKKLLEKTIFGETLEDREVSPLERRNSDHRCAIITFLTIEPDGRWRIVAVPVQCPNHSNLLESREQVKMDSLHMVSSAPITSYKVSQQSTQRKNPDAACSVKSYAARSFSGSNVQRHSRNKALATKATKTNELSGKPCQNSLTSSDFSSFLPSNSSLTSSSDSSKVTKVVKRNSRKKARKRGKQNKKLSSSCGSAEVDVISEECANGSLTSDICADNDTELGDGTVSCATSPAVSLTEFKVVINDSEGDVNAIVNCSDAQKACPSFTGEVDVEQGFSREHLIYYSENGIKPNGPGFAVFDGVEDTHCKDISCSDDTCSNALSDPRNSVVLNSVYVSCNSDDSTEAGFEATKDINDLKPSEASSYKSMNGCLSHQNSSNGCLDPCSHAEEPICGSQGHCSSDIRFSLHGKKGKQLNKVPKNSSAYRLNSGGTSQGWKENNHSVWQKVQKSDNNRCNCGEKKTNSVCLESDITLKEAPLLNNVVELDILSNSEDKSSFKVKVSRKLKRKGTLGSKQEFNSGSRNGSHVIKPSSNMHTKIHMQQKRRLDIPSLVNDKKSVGCISRSHSQNASPRVELCTDKVECIALEPIHSLQVGEDLKPIEKVCYTVSTMDVHTRGNQSNSFSKSCDSFSQSNLPEVHSQGDHPRLIGNEKSEAEKEVSHAENSKQDHGSARTLHKWMPIGMKDSVLTSMHRSDTSSLEPSAETAAEVLTSRSTEEEESALTYVPSGNAGLTCMSTISRNAFCSPPEDDAQIQNLRSQNTCSRIEQNVAANCLSHNMNDTARSMLETDSKKIIQAVNDVCRLQLVSEAVQMATGIPVAEFERLLHSASPVICQSHDLRSCQTCSPDQVFSASLCRHVIPSISLGSLWQWYEKHGSYGLEVMADDYKDTMRLGSDRSTFRAYFVPFLSAVQLFRNRNGNRMGSSGISSLDFSEAVASRELNNLELLFEYFEFEQPQRRRPLFEKIKELTRGESSQWTMYGDPTSLASINMCDLHPRSWYAVAWYPIYRIPDDNFRAAFLTYHSLGQLVRKSATLDSVGADACIVSPVVGLQSYNAQSECWFQPRHPEVGQTVENWRIKPMEILKERLRTLEWTASLMATASVSKGNLTSVNKHPDFEFFISRRH